MHRVLVALAMAALAALPVRAQTIRGRLLDVKTERPVDLGLVHLLTESGDSVTSTLTNPDGYFALVSAEPGSFYLLASAWGYQTTPAGVFELGEGGEMTIEFRIQPAPLPMDELLVELNRPVFEHKLVRRGFVDRYQRGLGVFLTPHYIEESTARATESLFEGIPGLTVRALSSAAGGSGPLTYLGDAVRMRTASGFLCTPGVFVDGVKVEYDHLDGRSLSTLVPLATVEAVEVYRRAAEVPVEFGVTQSRTEPGEMRGVCGVIAFWTRAGLAPGQAPAFGGSRSSTARPGQEVGASLPTVAEEGPAPTLGEYVRVELRTADSSLVSLFEGTFQGIRGSDFVVQDATTGRPTAIPLQTVEELQVRRQRHLRHALYRGIAAGTLMGVGSWVSLRFICGPACGRRDEAALPAVAIGFGFGLMFGSQGPGVHWVGAPLPRSENRDGL